MTAILDFGQFKFYLGPSASDAKYNGKYVLLIWLFVLER